LKAAGLGARAAPIFSFFFLFLAFISDSFSPIHSHPQMVATTFGHFGVGEEGRKGGDIAEEKSGVNDQGEEEKKRPTTTTTGTSHGGDDGPGRF
jgi:hypothetical protein